MCFSKTLYKLSDLCYNTIEVVAAAAADKARWNIVLGAVSRPSGRRLCNRRAISVSFLQVLFELLGETVHIVMLNASHIGALLASFRDWIKSERA